jgi:hypothetical protein
MDWAATQADLQRYATDDPVAVAELCGFLMGSLPRFTEPFARSFGIECIRSHRLPQRIDFLLGQQCFFPKDKVVLNDCVDWGTDDNGCVELQEKGDTFGHRHLLIHPKDPDYPIRYEVTDIDDCSICTPTLNWIFELQEGEIILPIVAAAFLDVHKTKRMILFLKWFSNILGFDGLQSRVLTNSP